MLYDLVDPALELSDPCPDIHLLFIDFNDRFFEGTLAQCEVKWSPRMFSCAGVCSYEGRGGMCSIRLSLPLLKLRPRKDLIETLLHEMIHAFLFVTQRNRDRDGHGPEFQHHMYRINRMANTNITIYHSFHDEVNVYKQHIWRCDGPCRDRRPFFGYVKRSSNRAPGPNDLWWNSHKASCNGTFQKIKEPDGYGQKKRKKPDEKEIPEKKPIAVNSLDRYFSNLGKGQTCGTLNRIEASPSTSTKPGPSTSTSVGKNRGKSKTSKDKGEKQVTPSKKTDPSTQRSPTLDIYIGISTGSSKPTPRALPSSTAGSADCPIVIESDPTPQSSSISAAPTAGNLDEVALNRNVICPSCGEDVIEYFINDHLDTCIFLH
ncbi:hypothetical protein OSTOST_22652 [Ostertagia ostertagi]